MRKLVVVFFLLLSITSLSFGEMKTKLDKLPDIAVQAIELLHELNLINVSSTDIVMVEKLRPWLKTKGYDKFVSKEKLEKLLASNAFTLVNIPGGQLLPPYLPIYIRKDTYLWNENIVRAQFVDKQFAVGVIASIIIHEFIHAFGWDNEVVAIEAELKGLYAMREKGYFKGKNAEAYIAEAEKALELARKEVQ